MKEESLKQNSARESLKNTGLVGGSQVFTILISIIRVKFTALLLGTTGMGIIQLFNSTILTVQSISNLGIGVTGVRDIAKSFSTNNDEEIAKSALTLKRWTWFTGLLGTLTTLVLSKQLSIWTFGDDNYQIEISILSITILIANIATGYSSIIRGKRRMADFAIISVVGAIILTVIAIPLYYFFKEKGILPVLILTGLINLILQYTFSRKIAIPKIKITYKESFFYGLDMVKLGLFTVISGFISNIAIYYVQISINNRLGVDHVSYYGVATTLAVTYMGLIFTAIATDYFPKLSSIQNDNLAINKAVLEQTKIGLLLGTPLIIAMYTFSDIIIQILYTKDFVHALPVLMWMLMAVFLRLLMFPIGYVFLAKGQSKVFIFTQSFWNVIFIGLVFVFWHYRGDLVGVGIAFTIAYVFGVIVNFMIIRKQTNFRYDSHTVFLIVVFSIIILCYFIFSYFKFTYWYVFSIKVLGLFLLSYYCYLKIESMVGLKIKHYVQSKIKSVFNKKNRNDNT